MSAAPLPRSVVLAVLGQTVISAGTHLSARAASVSLPPTSLAILRMGLTALVFALLLAVLRPRPGAEGDAARRFPPRSEWLTFLAWGFVAGPLNQGLFLIGIERSSASHAALLYALTPVAVLFMAVGLGRERLRVKQLAWILVALTGVVVLLIERDLAGPGDAAGVLTGDALMLGAVLAWAAWTLGSRGLSARWSPLQIAGWTMLAAGLESALAAPLLWRTLPDVVPPAAWLSLAWLVVMTSVVSYVLWSYALSRTEASRVAIFTNLQPLVTALSAWLLLGEAISGSLILGGLLIIAGVRQVQRTA
jgi:drug/metabolite transporter (DMT)-like permease